MNYQDDNVDALVQPSSSMSPPNVSSNHNVPSGTTSTMNATSTNSMMRFAQIQEDEDHERCSKGNQVNKKSLLYCVYHQLTTICFVLFEK